MKLYEFFGGVSDANHNNNDGINPRDELTGKTKQDEQSLIDDIFWYILDHDDFHKEFFLPLAQDIEAKQKSKKFDHGEYAKKWLPLVNKACIEYYKEKEMDGAPTDVFNKEMRQALCQRLADQHHKDIENGEYKLG